METTTVEPQVCTTLEADLLNMDHVMDNVLEKRRRIIDKIEAAVMVMKLDLDKESSEDIEAKMQAINSYSKLLVDQEKNVHTRVGVKLKQKDIENKVSLQVGVSEIVRCIQRGEGVDMPRVQLSEEERNKVLETVFEDRGCVVIDEELVDTSDTSDITTDMVKNIMDGGSHIIESENNDV